MPTTLEETARGGEIAIAPTAGSVAGGLIIDDYSPTSLATVQQIASSYRNFCGQNQPADWAALEEWANSAPPSRGLEAGLFRDVHRSNPDAANLLAVAVATMPQVGECLLGFRLISCLGQGAFARVFLARQGDLADRVVVLKVSAQLKFESQTLARLQHTNIVPIYSVHNTGPFQVLCMPYLGATTLADVYRSLEGMPSLPISGRGLVSTLKPNMALTATMGIASADEPPSPDIVTCREGAAHTTKRDGDGPVATLQMLGGLTYVESVLWLMARLADGLAHAHERGIVHRDIKSANVLLTDDGQPMLLDFNLSDDPLADSIGGVGGTLPYMAPEQLEAFRGTIRRADPRSDIFALGVVFYEMLTRHHPYPTRRPSMNNVVDVLIRDRSGAPPKLRPWNPAISFAVESIIRRCLESDPAKRYQSALQLKEDLERHLAHRPLRHASEPSLIERVGKWRRRHPVVSSTASLGTAAVVVVAALTAGLVARGNSIERFHAEDGLRATADDVHVAQALLFDRNAGSSRREAGIELCRIALDRFGVLGNPAWQTSSSVQLLSAEERTRVSDHVADLLYLLADVGRQRVSGSPSASAGDTLREALDMNALALACYESAAAPRPLWQQRANLAGLAGLTTEQRRAEREAVAARPRPDKDSLHSAYASYTVGKYREALPLLRRATLENPESFVAWFARGLCHYELMQDSDAVGCFNCCVALRPTFPWSWHNRGQALRRQRQFALARDDFDRFIALQPANPSGYVNRAIAAEGLNDYPAAAADLSRALKLAERQNASLTTIYFLRASVRAKLKEMETARSDHAEGMRRQPTDEGGFIDRGIARVESDPSGALADFEEAIRINPLSFDGLQNKAAILSDKFGRDAESLQVMDRAVQLYPDSVLARSGRGVLLARRGDRTRALDDAQASLLLDTSPPTLYQVACIFALSSKLREQDRLQALQLLSEALQKGFGLDLVAGDKDLDPIRELPEFDRLVSAAQSVARASRPPVDSR